MSLEVVIGPMFSGKSSYALSYVRRQRAIGKKVVIIKPDIDNRYSQKDVLITHDKEQTPCLLWNVNQDLYPTEIIRDSDCIVFEEAQFFKGLYDTVHYILEKYKKHILVVGLDGDAHQRPFGEILNCIPLANSVKKLSALCSICNNGVLAHYTKRIHDNISSQIDVGGHDKYQSVCLKHLK